MEVKAVGKYMRVQPRKVRIIADEIRGKNAAQAAQILRFHPSKSAKFLRKILISAMANASENNNLSVEALKVSRITVDEGPRLKRIQARAMGRAFRIVKKTSHITVVVEEAEGQARIKPHGTKEKPRRTLDAPKKAKKKDEAPVAEVAPVVEETLAETPIVEEATVETAEAATTEVDAVAVETEVAAADEAPEDVADSAADATVEAVAATEDVTAEETPAEEQKEGEN